MFLLTVLAVVLVSFLVLTASNVIGADLAWERQRKRWDRLEKAPLLARLYETDETDEQIEARILEEDKRTTRTRARYERYEAIRSRLEREGKVKPYADGVFPMTAIEVPIPCSHPAKSKAS